MSSGMGGLSKDFFMDQRRPDDSEDYTVVTRQHAQSKQMERNRTRKTYQNSSSQTFYFSVQCFQNVKLILINSIFVSCLPNPKKIYDCILQMALSPEMSMFKSVVLY